MLEPRSRVRRLTTGAIVIGVIVASLSFAAVVYGSSSEYTIYIQCPAAYRDKQGCIEGSSTGMLAGVYGTATEFPGVIGATESTAPVGAVTGIDFAKSGNGYIAKREGASQLYEIDPKSVDGLLKSADSLTPAAPPTPPKK